MHLNSTHLKGTPTAGGRPLLGWSSLSVRVPCLYPESKWGYSCYSCWIKAPSCLLFSPCMGIVGRGRATVGGVIGIHRRGRAKRSVALQICLPLLWLVGLFRLLRHPCQYFSCLYSVSVWGLRRRQGRGLGCHPGFPLLIYFSW